MASPVEVAVENYIRLFSEPDAAARAKRLAACFAEDGRMVTQGRELRGHAALASMIERFIADPRLLRIRMASPVDAVGTIFRYRAIADFRDGTSVESFDAGEIDSSGRISVLLTFTGPLPEVEGGRVVFELTA